MKVKNLQTKLGKLDEMFDLSDVLQLKADLVNNIASYYKTNKLAYKLFHSKTDFIHMGISENQSYSEKDLFKQAEIIETYLNATTTDVLEIGCGKGKNLEFLAYGNPKINFFGLDLESGQTDIALKKAADLENLTIEYGDFHNLSKFYDKKFDVVFAIEALCHSNDKSKVAYEVPKILKPNGLLIVFDGYLGTSRKSLNDETLEACKLVEKGMMVDSFEEYNVVKSKIVEAGFKLESELDYSPNILPTLHRFERLANIAFSMGRFSKVLLKFLPPNFKYNSISGYLMPDLIKTGIAQYYFSAFRKV